MLNYGGVLLAVLNLYVPIKIHLGTFDTDHSVTCSTQTVNRCFDPEASSQSAQQVIDRRCIGRNDQDIDLFEVGRRFFARKVQNS